LKTISITLSTTKTNNWYFCFFFIICTRTNCK